MNIRFSLLLCLCLVSTVLHNTTPPLPYTHKQKAVLLLKSITPPVWHSTAPHHTIDPLFKTHHLSNALPGLPAKAEFFFMRTPHVTTVQNLINPAAFNDTMLQPFVDYGHALELQQHTTGIQIGQLWNQDNLEISWQWWVGAQERNWWLTQKMRKAYQETLKNYHGSALKGTGNIHAPQEPEHRLTLWHGTNTTVGIGDVHLQGRYRAHPTNWFSCSLGCYLTIPVGTQSSHTTPLNSDDTLPIATDELPLRIINRLRDVMLCAPLGANGHLGIGFQTDAHCFITGQLSLRGSFTQMHYRAGIENRYALLSSPTMSPLEEGLPGSEEGISSPETIVQYLKQTVYPCTLKAHVKPGMVRITSGGLHYEDIPLHLAMIYSHELVGGEYSESAPLATLNRTSTQNHQISGVAGWRKSFQWGQSSLYLNGHYTVSGTHRGCWGFGIGASVQA